MKHRKQNGDVATELPEGTYVVGADEIMADEIMADEIMAPAPPAESDIYPGDAVEERAAPAPQQPIPHFNMTLEGHFWFQNAYRELLDGLPQDRPSEWVEVGVLYGQSLAWLGVEIVNRGLPTTLHAVDSFAGWPGVLQGKALRAAFDKNMAPVAERMGDRFRVHPLASPAAAAEFPDASLDVVWLDADHSYEAVTKDIAAWLPKIRAGGTLGGDDWEMGGVAKAVGEAFPSRHTLGTGSRNGVRWPWWMVRVGG